MADNHWWLVVLSSLFHNGTGKGLIDRDIARLPRIMNVGVNIWVIRGVPHVVLEEPK